MDIVNRHQTATLAEFENAKKYMKMADETYMTKQDKNIKVVNWAVIKILGNRAAVNEYNNNRKELAEFINKMVNHLRNPKTVPMPNIATLKLFTPVGVELYEDETIPDPLPYKTELHRKMKTMAASP